MKWIIGLTLAFMCCSSSYIPTYVHKKITLSSRDAVHSQCTQFLRSLISSRDIAIGSGHCIAHLRGGDDSDDGLGDEDNEDKSQDDDEVRHIDDCEHYPCAIAQCLAS